MFLVLTEVSRAYIFNFLHLFIVAFLQGLAMRGSLICYLKHVSLEGVSFSVHLALQQVFHILNRVLEGASVLRADFLQSFNMLHVLVVVAVYFLIDILI